MAGIYLHIPFCKSKCHYCNFYSLASLRHKDDFLEAILKEIEVQKDYLNSESIETIYFGGGTPSILQPEDLERILNQIHRYFPVQADAEFDLEANPDDIAPANLHAWRQMGINRLSIGTQAFDDDILQKLNRVHNARQAVDSVRQAREAGFSNISIDLIYGIPGLTKDKWRQSIEQALQLQVPHLSAYHLTVEPGTALEVLIRKKKYPRPAEEEGVAHFEILMDRIQQAGFEHYEISNFALPGQYSRHNTNYWLQKPYLGLGPSAHSYDLKSRQWNVASITKYITALQKGRPDFEKEIISQADAYNEFVMLGLRTQWGIDGEKLEELFGSERSRQFQKTAQRFLNGGQMETSGTIYRLTNQGKLFADGIAGSFFV